MTSLTFMGRQLISVDYAEPAAELLLKARDVTPGTSVAEENAGDK